MDYGARRSPSGLPHRGQRIDWLRYGLTRPPVYVEQNAVLVLGGPRLWRVALYPALLASAPDEAAATPASSPSG
jgi:hypothetical protein